MWLPLEQVCGVMMANVDGKGEQGQTTPYMTN